VESKTGLRRIQEAWRGMRKMGALEAEGCWMIGVERL
jgi:hypothetical protein